MLQGFPADWPLQGNRHQQYTQVGNAVPPSLAEAAGKTIRVAHEVWRKLRAQGHSPAALTQALRRHQLSLPVWSLP